MRRGELLRCFWAVTRLAEWETLPPHSACSLASLTCNSLHKMQRIVPHWHTEGAPKDNGWSERDRITNWPVRNEPPPPRLVRCPRLYLSFNTAFQVERKQLYPNNATRNNPEKDDRSMIDKYGGYRNPKEDHSPGHYYLASQRLHSEPYKQSDLS